MSLNRSSLLKLSVAGAILLSVGACKPADKGQGALKSEGVAALNLSKGESNVFAKYFVTDACEVDDMEALGALAGLGLGENGTNGLSFKSRDIRDGIVSYRDLVLKEKGAKELSFSAGSAVFHCPKMGEEAPLFDRLDLTDVLIKDEKENVEFTAETLNISEPTSDAARSIVESMTKPDSSGVNNVGFGAISITGVKIKSDELMGTLKAMSWGEMRDDKGQGTADLTLADLELTVSGENGAQDMTIDFSGLSARNVNVGNKRYTEQAMSPNGLVGSVLGNLNAFEKPYDELIVEQLKINAEGFAVDFGGIEGLTTEKSGVITTRQTLKPTQISFKPALADMPSFARNYEILKSLDFETITLSGSSVTTLNKDDDSMSVSDGLFVMDDALRLNFEYSAEGLEEMTQKAQSMLDGEEGTDVMAVYDALKLRDLRLTLEDNSIVSRGMKLATEMTGQSEKNIKRSLGMAVFAAALAAENEVQAEVYSETVEAFADFVKKGGTLTIEANPPAPFPLAPLFTGKGEGVDPDSLGFSAQQAGGEVE